jgi:uncharacterized membrane protein (UPF0136 family)
LTQLAIWFILLYALIILAGGIFGYVKASSKASLISGIGSGVALALVWGLSSTSPLWGLGLASLIAHILLVVFVIRFIRTRKVMPAAVMAGLSLAFALFFTITCLQLVLGGF